MSETGKTVLCMKTHIKLEVTVVPWARPQGTQQLPTARSFPNGFLTASTHDISRVFMSLPLISFHSCLKSHRIELVCVDFCEPKTVGWEWKDKCRTTRNRSKVPSHWSENTVVTLTMQTLKWYYESQCLCYRFCGFESQGDNLAVTRTCANSELCKTMGKGTTVCTGRWLSHSWDWMNHCVHQFLSSRLAKQK